jgi:ribosomal protein S18 acetylase RimI-like enzyme
MAKTAPNIRYVQRDKGALDEIKLLWESLNRCMGERSTFFKAHFAAMTWEKRKADLLAKAVGGQMRIDIALDSDAKGPVGYLVSSLSAERIGVVESVFVSEGYRRLGIGEALMRRALAWMDQNGAVEKTLEVTVGNEPVFGFYGRFGFLPRQTLLKQVKI